MPKKRRRSQGAFDKTGFSNCFKKLWQQIWSRICKCWLWTNLLTNWSNLMTLFWKWWIILTSVLVFIDIISHSKQRLAYPQVIVTAHLIIIVETIPKCQYYKPQLPNPKSSCKFCLNSHLIRISRHAIDQQWCCEHILWSCRIACGWRK